MVGATLRPKPYLQGPLTLPGIVPSRQADIVSVERYHGGMASGEAGCPGLQRAGACVSVLVSERPVTEGV